MINDKMREEFETWHKAEVANFVAADQIQAARVLSHFKQTALAIWEASRAGVPDMTAARAAIRQALPDVPGDSLDHGLLAVFEAAGLGVRS